MKQDTKCVQAGYEPKNGEPRVLPLYQSTTYVAETADYLARLFDLSEAGHIYSRISNPTVDAYEKKLAALEDGVGALACSSGLAAEALAIMNVAHAGDNIVSVSTIYGGTYNLFKVTLPKYGITTRFVSPTATREEIVSQIDDNTKVIYCETIANPNINIADFELLSSVAKEKGVILMVDNTLATPILCNPKKFGANIIVHSSTKYLDGHASCVGGAIVDCGNFDYSGNPRYKEFGVPDESYHGLVYNSVAPAAFITKARVQLMRDFGMCISPFNAYLTNLGTETLHLRMERHSVNALALAKELEKNKNVEWVKYPGLESSPEHARYVKYYNGRGASGMLSIGVKGGREGAKQFMENLKLFKIVTHIADTRSCVLHPATTTHRQLSDSDLIAAGVADNLVRISVGIEDTEDVVNDVINALNAIKL